MKKRLLVFSVDAMVREDVEYLKTLPNFKRCLAGGSEITHMKTIYPSVTYPAHVSLITGCYAGKHGVVSNFGFTTDNKDDTWLWFADNIKVKDIFSAAKQAGYSTASVFWPVTGCHPDIDYLIDEYWMPLPGDTLEGSFRRAGSSEEVISIIKKNAHLLPPTYEKGGKKNIMAEPYADNFLISCMCDIIEEYAPEVSFVHNGYLDNARHQNGQFNSEVTHGVELVDAWLGQLIDALERRGVLEETNIVMVSDHGQINLTRTVKPNVYLADAGYIDVNENGEVLDWRAFSFSNAMSAMVYLKHPEDTVLHDEVYAYLQHLAKEGLYGFSEVFTKKEIEEKEHLTGDFSFVLETDGYTSFSDSCIRPLVQQKDLSDFRFAAASHGYLPEKGPQPVFLAKGPDFNENVTISDCSIVDVAPTLATVLNVDLPEAQGTSLEKMLKKDPCRN